MRSGHPTAQPLDPACEAAIQTVIAVCLAWARDRRLTADDSLRRQAALRRLREQRFTAEAIRGLIEMRTGRHLISRSRISQIAPTFHRATTERH